MAWSPAAVVTFLVGVGLSSARSDAPLRRPRLTGCVFLERENVTCRWEHQTTSPTNYTLSIWESTEEEKFLLPRVRLLSGRSTDRSCTVQMSGVTSREVFCIEVTAHTKDGELSSDPRCQSGRLEVKLPPVRLRSVAARGAPARCLHVEYEADDMYFPVSRTEVNAGSLDGQIKFQAEGESAEVKDVAVSGFRFRTCGFRPDTSYGVRLRLRYLSAASPWSEWSPPLTGRTGVAAPSVAPVFWRRVEENPQGGSRRVTLLWKPLPRSLANGEVVFYNVTCRSERSADPRVPGACGRLDANRTSCSLSLPVQPCSCGLTASTSAGASPEARLWFQGASEKAPAAPSLVRLRPLNDSVLEVSWTAPAERTASGFVVEWLAVREQSSSNSSSVHWQHVGPSVRTLVVTEGVEPLQRYAVSVSALYGWNQTAGRSGRRHVYTREGTPSAGPHVNTGRISSNGVELSWSPVPVEELHGFLHDYTVYITAPNNHTRNVSVPAHATRHTLEKLSPGNHRFSVGANTDAGAGPAGKGANVYIAAGTPVVAHALLAFALTALALPLAYLAYAKTSSKKLFKHIPDPRNSTLSRWSPGTNTEKKQFVDPGKAAIKVSEVTLLKAAETPDPDVERSVQGTCSVQIHRSRTSPLHIDIAQRLLLRRLAGLGAASVGDLSAHPFLLPDVCFPQALTSPAAPLLSSSSSSSYRQFSAFCRNDATQPAGGAGEPLAPFPRQHQSLCSLAKLSSDAPPPPPPPPPPPAPPASFARPFSPGSFRSFLSLHPITSAPAKAPPDGAPDAFQPPSSSILVDFSYCPVRWDPYIPCDT